MTHVNIDVREVEFETPVVELSSTSGNIWISVSTETDDTVDILVISGEDSDATVGLLKFLAQALEDNYL